MALRERSGSRSVKGRHRAASASTRVAVPDERTSHRWTSAEAEEWAARRARWAERIPAPRRASEPVAVPAPRRAADECRASSGVRSGPPDGGALGRPDGGAVGGSDGGALGRPDDGRARGTVGGMRAEAVRAATASLAGARLAAAVLTRATGREPEPGVQAPPVDPWGRRTLPVRYRPLPRRRRRMAGVWILLALLLVAAVGAIPSALRDPAIRATATESAAAENVGGGGGGGPVVPAPAEFNDQLPDGRAQTAIDAALAQVGVPYQWGGNGPAAGDAGFDCSGLTTFAYAAAGIALPRTAHTQYAAGPHVPADAPLQPGDLVFYGSPSAVYHVGIYLGDGRMVIAPNYDQPVQVSHYRWRGDEYLGATRPAATGERRAGLLEVLPEPRSVEGWPRSFDAPRAAAPVERVQPSFALPAESATAAASIAAAEGAAAQPRPAAATPAAWRPSGTWTIPAARHQARTAPALAPAEPAGDPAEPVAAPGGQTAAAQPGDAQPASPAVAQEEPVRGRSGAPGVAEPGTVSAAAAQGVDAVVGALTLPSGTVPLVAARLDPLGVPVAPAPGTAALLDEGGAQLVLLSGAIPLDDSVTVAVDGADPRERTVVEAQSLTAAQLAAHVRTLPAGEFQIASASADGTWSVAELE
jgi:cell wall-associated NlpC family hydrolase